MKKISLIIFLFINFYGISQMEISYSNFSTTYKEYEPYAQFSKSITTYNNYEVFKWEAKTYNRQVVFGVAKTRRDVLKVINDYNQRNKKTNYKLRFIEVFRDSISYIGHDDYFEVFNKRCPKGYYLLTLSEQKATDEYVTRGLYDAINFYRNEENIPYFTAKSHIENLLYNLSQFRINFKYNPHGQSN